MKSLYGRIEYRPSCCCSPVLWRNTPGVNGGFEWAETKTTDPFVARQGHKILGPALGTPGTHPGHPEPLPGFHVIAT